VTGTSGVFVKSPAPGTPTSMLYSSTTRVDAVLEHDPAGRNDDVAAHLQHRLRGDEAPEDRENRHPVGAAEFLHGGEPRAWWVTAGQYLLTQFISHN
jgi:hypothetical protein